IISVRSGAAVSMPGMMDTVLNLGLNDETLKGLIKQTKNERFALDSYRRLIQMFGDIVLKVEHKKFDNILDKIKKAKGVKLDAGLNAENLNEVVDEYKTMIKKETGKFFPKEPRKQLQMTIDAVFGSWDSKRAVAYRRIHEIKGLIGTAVNVQDMVFGNMGNDSATGVAFTRNPSTGEKRFYGEFLINAQGEDIVAGIMTPRPIRELQKYMSKPYKELFEAQKKLENHYKDMQDIEFTIEKGNLYILQTRNGKRTIHAAVKIAVDMVNEGLITKEDAVLRIDAGQLEQLLHKSIDPKADVKVIAKGLPASPGAAVGEAYFTTDKVKDMAELGEKVILVRAETSPEDIEGMHAAQGILTSRGGVTSHAALVSRGMGKPCIVGAEKISVDEQGKKFSVNGTVVKEGDKISLNGTTGEVLLGDVPLVEPKVRGEFKTLMGLADSIRKLRVRANADTPHDSKIALVFGAQGIGLCRTEHMFFGETRIQAIRKMMMADTKEARGKALGKIMPMQKKDFKGIFKVMDGLPVNIRLLDPPLHEFLPTEKEDIKALAKEMNINEEKINKLIEVTKEFNPMLGFRGCRIAIIYPAILEMQITAIMEAACECVKEGIKVEPEIMIPLTGAIKEYEVLHDNIHKISEEIIKKNNVKVSYSIGTMIEVPRACIIADKLAGKAEFFSFGTNDLTQMTFGYSRDDAGKFLPVYIEKGILDKDPFVSIDLEGVGSLMKSAVEKSRKVNPKIKIGICGEHGGEPASVEFCSNIGLSYVSCSPHRIPIAKLAAAQAVLKKH
ncbi:MAG: pyruvate, phosphate dikinase, partial [Candidatus Omnitrophica bacterium]|nr:pyruvate, phosphate dikinase [Candidatus Omnitrophota bacterium]